VYLLLATSILKFFLMLCLLFWELPFILLERLVALVPSRPQPRLRVTLLAYFFGGTGWLLYRHGVGAAGAFYGREFDDLGPAIAFYGVGLGLAIYGRFGRRFHPVLAVLVLLLGPCVLILDQSGLLLPVRSTLPPDSSPQWDQPRMLFWILLVCDVIGVAMLWWRDFTWWHPRPNAGGRELGDSASSRRPPLRCRTVAAFCLLVLTVWYAGFAALLALGHSPSTPLAASIAITFTLAAAVVVVPFDRFVTSRRLFPWFMTAIGKGRPAFHVAGKIRAFATLPAGADGLGACVCSVPRAGLRENSRSAAQGRSFAVETLGGLVYIDADDPLAWVGMQAAPTSLPRAEAEIAESLCLRDGDEAVIWFFAEEIDTPPESSAYRGELRARCFRMCPCMEGEVALVGLGSFEQQRDRRGRSGRPNVDGTGDVAGAEVP